MSFSPHRARHRLSLHARIIRIIDWLIDISGCERATLDESRKLNRPSLARFETGSDIGVPSGIRAVMICSSEIFLCFGITISILRFLVAVCSGSRGWAGEGVGCANSILGSEAWLSYFNDVYWSTSRYGWLFSIYVEEMQLVAPPHECIPMIVSAGLLYNTHSYDAVLSLLDLCHCLFQRSSWVQMDSGNSGGLRRLGGVSPLRPLINRLLVISSWCGAAVLLITVAMRQTLIANLIYHLCARKLGSWTGPWLSQNFDMT